MATDIKTPFPKATSPAKSSSSPASTETADDGVEYVTITDANGATYRIPKSMADESRKEKEADKEPEFYVHLANGDVVTVSESELPTASGSNAVHGYWDIEGVPHLVIAVYPAEA
jgi:hypothetical protein